MSQVHLIDGSVLEGLFVRELKPDGPFKEELKRVGFDLDRLQPQYADEVFRAAIDVAARYACPGMSATRAHFELGERLLTGYFSTILGRITAGLIPVLGVKRTLARVSQLWQVPMRGMTIVSNESAEGWLVDFHNQAMSPDLVAGIVSCALRRADQRVVCMVVKREPFAGQLSVRLEPGSRNAGQAARAP